MKYDKIATTINKEAVLTYDSIEELRKRKSDKRILAQRGCQEKFLSNNVNIVIFGGNRGGSKSFSLLMEALKDIDNRYFRAVILRNERDDLEGLEKDATLLYSQFGTYNKSKNDMTWNFNSGGTLKFTYFAGDYESFVKRFQGRQYAYIGVDEITHIPYNKFKYLITDNRNAHKIRCRFFGTCNPDPDSWVRVFIDWWIGEDGIPIPERDGVVRYCFMDGNTPDSIYWGDTREEVYLQCQSIIDGLWKPEYEELGFDKMELFIKSVTFVRGKLEENVALISSDPNYVANLAQQDEEQRARDLDGNWNFKAVGDDLIKMDMMEKFYSNAYQLDDNILRASCDVAFDGGDNLVLCLWVGMHLKDIFVIQSSSKEATALINMKLHEWGVLEENFVYDLNGVGQTLKGFFPKAVGFNNMGAPIPPTQKEKDSIKYMFSSLKSQCAYKLVEAFEQGLISIEPTLLTKKFSGRGYHNVPLRQILMKERKAIKKAVNERAFTIIKKNEMKKFVGHSPDFIEAFIYRMYFNITKVKSSAPKKFMRYVQQPNRFRR